MHASHEGRKDRRQHRQQEIRHVKIILGNVNNNQHDMRRKYAQNGLYMVFNTLVFSKLYYCSSVWLNTSDSNVKKFQSIQNFTAHVVTNTRKSDHITQALKSLKWTPIKTNLYFRDAVMDFKCIMGIRGVHRIGLDVYNPTIR